MTSKGIVFVVGPTAIGKSAVAFHLARRLKTEIISCDSMQIYKEITIASGKPTPAERKAVVHHLIDVASVTEEFDVVAFSKRVSAMIKAIHQKGMLPIIVGGSGLYMQILLDGIFEGKGKDDRLRQELKSLADTKGVSFLYKRLETVDPDAAAKMHPNDLRRIVRALEVYEHTRQPISTLQRKRSGLWGNYDIWIFGLKQPREDLYEKINARVDEMFRVGLVEEIAGLKESRLSLTAQHLIGVKEVLSYLRGESSLEETREKLKQNTRHLAKKQMTWFNKDKRIEWIDFTDAAQTAAVILSRLREAHETKR